MPFPLAQSSGRQLVHPVAAGFTQPVDVTGSIGIRRSAAGASAPRGGVFSPPPGAAPGSVGPRRGGAGAAAGPTGGGGATGPNRRYGCPWAGRWSTSPLFGQSDAARSAWAVMLSEGLTPMFAEIAAPSTTDSVGYP